MHYIVNYIISSPILQFIQLVSDLGGNTGLWVGFCVLSVVEWFVLGINICYLCCCGKRNAGRTKPSKADEANGSSHTTIITQF